MADPATMVKVVHDTLLVHDTLFINETLALGLDTLSTSLPVKLDETITRKDVISWLLPAAIGAGAALLGAWLAGKAVEREWKLARRLELTRLKERTGNNLRRALKLIEKAEKLNADEPISLEIAEELEVLWNLYYRVAGPVFTFDEKLATRLDEFFLQTHIWAECIKALEKEAVPISRSVQPADAYYATEQERKALPGRRKKIIDEIVGQKAMAQWLQQHVAEVDLKSIPAERLSTL